MIEKWNAFWYTVTNYSLTFSLMKKILFWLGMLIVVGSHIYILAAGLPADQVLAHSIANFVAAGFFAGAYF